MLLRNAFTKVMTVSLNRITPSPHVILMLWERCIRKRDGTNKRNSVSFNRWNFAKKIPRLLPIASSFIGEWGVKVSAKCV